MIPVRDRHAELARCLAGLRDDPADERGPGRPQPRPLHPASCRVRPSRPRCPAARPPVIVVDDASADPVAIAAIAAAYGARVIRRPVNGGPGAARNTGLAAASTELVAFLDSDCVPEPGWLDRLLPHFADPAVGAVAPRIVPHEAGTSWLARYEGASSTLDMGARPSIVRPGARVSYVPGAALVVRRAAAGPGSPTGCSWARTSTSSGGCPLPGWRVRYEPSATMGHDHRVRFRAWFSRRADYGTSAATLEQLHPGAVRPLYASWWTVGAWTAALSGRPAAPAHAAAALTAAATALLARRLSTVTAETWPLPSPPRPRPPSRPGAEAWRPRGWRAAEPSPRAVPIGSALSRTWWPLAIPAAIAVPGAPPSPRGADPRSRRCSTGPTAGRRSTRPATSPPASSTTPPTASASGRAASAPHDRPAASRDWRQAPADRLTGRSGLGPARDAAGGGILHPWTSSRVDRQPHASRDRGRVRPRGGGPALIAGCVALLGGRAR